MREVDCTPVRSCMACRRSGPHQTKRTREKGHRRPAHLRGEIGSDVVPVQQGSGGWMVVLRGPCGMPGCEASLGPVREEKRSVREAVDGEPLQGE
jgi:hypothetical protein